MERQIEWQLSNGATATYIVAQLPNEFKQSMKVTGFGYIAPYINKLAAPKTVNGVTLVASIGDEIGITEDIYTRIMAATAEVAPEWVAEQAERLLEAENSSKATYARRGNCSNCAKRASCSGECTL